MSDYNAYGELYDQRPELVIHDRLRHSGESGESADKAQSHTVTSGLRYFRRLGGGT